jgi:hypothetical protein
MEDLKLLQTALDALLLWEEMEPKTAARTVRNRAIEELQAKIRYIKLKGELMEEFKERLSDLPKPKAS